MSKPRAICVGEILWDRLIDRGLPIQDLDYPGGAPANVACGLVKLGIPAAFMGAVGQDEAGDRLLEVLAVHGVNHEAVQKTDRAPTRTVLVQTDATGDRRFVGFFPSPDPLAYADAHWSPGALPRDLFATAEVLVLGTLALASPTAAAAIGQSLELADEFYLKIVLDMNWRPVFWPQPDQARSPILDLMERVDFLKLSRDEAEWLLGSADPALWRDRFDQLEGVLITDGAAGCRYCLGDHCDHVPAFAIAVKEPTGAGDAFTAAFVAQILDRGLAALADPKTAREVVRFASAAGALATTQHGAIAALPTRSAIDQLMDY